MQEEKKQVVFVIGHMNPDTDSVCSAIAYANLKNHINGDKITYKARRAGQLNAETNYVLDKFKVKPPVYLSDVRTQVKDINVQRVNGVTKNISIKKAWDMMGQEDKIVTLPILNEEKDLEGLITVGDIATSYMDIYDSEILTKAKTPVVNIIETLNGELVVGDKEAVLSEGKVLIAAANPDLMESYIRENDIVILGNRYESQLCAIEMNARCIIVCDGAEVSITIRKLATNKNCLVIKSPYDTFTVARLINQSIPVEFFMKTGDFVGFKTDDFLDDIREVMAKIAHRNFPIFDKDGKFFGMISRRNLLDTSRKKIILVDHNERDQAVDGLDEANILEIIDHHRIGSVETINPIFFRNQPLGSTATIIYQMYIENCVEIEQHIAGLLCSAILSDTLVFRSPTCTPYDKMAAEKLAEIAGINIEEHANAMFTAGSGILNKSVEEIFYSDYKKFSAENVNFCVGQITSLNGSAFDNMKEDLRDYLEEVYASQDLDMIILMLTDIMKERSELIFTGSMAKNLIQSAFHIEVNDGEDCILEGVISRKKQLIPPLMFALQIDNNI